MLRALLVLPLSFSLSLSALAQEAAPEPTDAAPAEAAPAGDPLAKENWPLSAVDRPLGVSGGMLQIDLWTATNLSTGAVGKPFSLPLGIYFGATNELQFALLHVTGVCP